MVIHLIIREAIEAPIELNADSFQPWIGKAEKLKRESGTDRMVASGQFVKFMNAMPKSYDAPPAGQVRIAKAFESSDGPAVLFDVSDPVAPKSK